MDNRYASERFGHAHHQRNTLRGAKIQALLNPLSKRLQNVMLWFIRYLYGVI
jgi:hypothetical protein